MKNLWRRSSNSPTTGKIERSPPTSPRSRRKPPASASAAASPRGLGAGGGEGVRGGGRRAREVHEREKAELEARLAEKDEAFAAELAAAEVGFDDGGVRRQGKAEEGGGQGRRRGEGAPSLRGDARRTRNAPPRSPPSSRRRRRSAKKAEAARPGKRKNDSPLLPRPPNPRPAANPPPPPPTPAAAATAKMLASKLAAAGPQVGDRKEESRARNARRDVERAQRSLLATALETTSARASTLGRNPPPPPSARCAPCGMTSRSRRVCPPARAAERAWRPSWRRPPRRRSGSRERRPVGRRRRVPP